jgi:arsenical pump membrane protein
VGTVVTTFLSNDATAVVLTPAVAAVAKTARAKEPLPYLFICAFTANAAGFVLPISNPANLVVYGSRMPSLMQWLPRYTLPSIVSIVATYLMLRWTQRERLRERISADIEVPTLSSSGKLAASGIAATAVVLLTSSAFNLPLGLPTFLAGAATAGLVLTRAKTPPGRFAEEHLLGRAAAGCRSLRAGRGLGEDRRYRAPGAPASQSCPKLNDAGGLDGGHDARRRL